MESKHYTSQVFSYNSNTKIMTGYVQTKKINQSQNDTDKLIEQMAQS
jgi:hypothetical protein